MKNEIIIYQSDKKSARLEVRIEEETVWLNRQQISVLFDRDIKTVGKHIANSLREELSGFSVVAIFATTEKGGVSHWSFFERLGKKWFAFSKMEMDAEEITRKLKQHSPK